MTINSKKTLGLPLRISIAVLLIGLLSHILHFQYSWFLIPTALCAIIVLYSFRFYFKASKKIIDYIKLILVIFYSLHAFISIMHWSYIFPFNLIAAIAGLAWLFMEGFYYFGESEQVENKRSTQFFSSSLFGLAVIFIFAGVMFKIMHWPYAPTLLIIGVAIAIIWLLSDLFTEKNKL